MNQPPAVDDPFSVPVRDAATVMIVRPAQGAIPGLEVALLRRSLSASFVGGAYVFPGGAIDPSDRNPRWGESLVHGLSDRTASALLGLEEHGLSFWIAAARESFEESGILLAVSAETHEWLSATELDSDTLSDARVAVHNGTLDFAEFLWERNLVIDATRLRAWSRWVTPIGSHRRFDTRFLVAEAPPWAEPRHDGSETIESEWSTPNHALERFRAGHIDLIFPTVKSLESLGRVATVTEALHIRRRPNVSD
jgi:8-oxo-dGTP pyrophosphatase MutT (NUDIX family)